MAFNDLNLWVQWKMIMKLLKHPFMRVKKFAMSNLLLFFQGNVCAQHVNQIPSLNLENLFFKRLQTAPGQNLGLQALDRWASSSNIDTKLMIEVHDKIFQFVLFSAMLCNNCFSSWCHQMATDAIYLWWRPAYLSPSEDPNHQSVLGQNWQDSQLYIYRLYVGVALRSVRQKWLNSYSIWSKLQTIEFHTHLHFILGRSLELENATVLFLIPEKCDRNITLKNSSS